MQSPPEELFPDFFPSIILTDPAAFAGVNDRAYKSLHRTYSFDSTPEFNRLLNASRNKQSFLYIDSLIVVLAQELLNELPSAACCPDLFYRSWKPEYRGRRSYELSLI
jgi:hypothetical protein